MFANEGNGGGSAADYIIEVLERDFDGYFNNVAGDRYPFTSPSAGIWGPKVMIVNEMAGSGGDLMPYMFKRRKIGPLIGKRTWGGLVHTADTPPFIDGGSMIAPRGGFFTRDGKWAVENEGVAPDVDVENWPKDVIAGLAATSAVPVVAAHETRQGKSFALNLGLEIASGDIIALTDDDVMTESDWLSRIVADFRARDVTFVFGKVLPWWERTAPSELLLPRGQAIWTGALLLAYWGAMTLVPVPGHGAGDLGKEWNLAAYLDRALLGPQHLWRVAKVYDPEGLLSTVPAVANQWKEFASTTAIRGEPLPAGDYVIIARSADGKDLSGERFISVSRNRSQQFYVPLK